MSKTTQYADLGKTPADLIKRGFPAEGFAVLSEAKVPLGCAVKTNLSKGPRGVKLIVENTDYSWAAVGAQWTYKGKWQSDNFLEKSVAVSDLGTPGTEVKPWYKQELVPQYDAAGNEQKDKDKLLQRSVGLSVGFANEFVNLSLKPETDPTFTNRKLDASLVIQAPTNLFWGFKAKYNPEPAPAEGTPDRANEKSAWDIEGKLHYVLPDSSFTLAYEPDPNDKKKSRNKTPVFLVSKPLFDFQNSHYFLYSRG